MRLVSPAQQRACVLPAGFVVDLVSDSLRTADGAFVELRPRSFAVLRLLAQNLGRVVSRGEIMASVWNDAAVTDDVLTQCIVDIRRAIGDTEHRTLRTVPRRGYLLTGTPGEPARPEAAAPEPALAPAGRVVPETRYARSGAIHIAYQVTGEGPVDVVFVQGYVTHLELEWEDPRPARFFEQLSSFCRLIRFDKRGTGLSDRVSGLPTLEERMDDVRAVMDAAGSQRAVLLGCSEGGPMSILFAATHPERVRSLMLCGVMARIAWAPDHPWGRTAEQLATNVRIIEEKWGSGHSVDLFAPSIAGDPAYRAWRGRLDRAAASPGAAITLARMNFDIDVRHVLPSIAVPTLVVHRTGDIAVNVEHGRHLAGLIPRARYLELPGRDHALWASDTQILCDTLRAFINEAEVGPDRDRVLATILIAEPGSEADEAASAGVLRRQIALHRGREVGAGGNAPWTVIFDGPARAVRCARAIIEALRASGMQARVGVHTGECELRDGKLEGVAFRIAAHVAKAAAPGQVLVTSTVRDLVAGSGLRFVQLGERSFPGLPGSWVVLIAG